MNELERIRAIQQMIFGSQAGQSIREMFLKAGHFYEELETDRDRIEHNMVKKMMEACGVAIELRPKSLPDVQVMGNVIDMVLEQGDGR